MMHTVSKVVRGWGGRGDKYWEQGTGVVSTSRVMDGVERRGLGFRIRVLAHCWKGPCEDVKLTAQYQHGKLFAEGCNFVPQSLFAENAWSHMSSIRPERSFEEHQGIPLAAMVPN